MSEDRPTIVLHIPSGRLRFVPNRVLFRLDLNDDDSRERHTDEARKLGERLMWNARYLAAASNQPHTKLHGLPTERGP